MGRAAVALAVAALVTAGAGSGAGGSSRETPVFGYRVVASWPHDPRAYTEGLALAGGFLYESTGLNGRSSVRKVELRTGRVLSSVPLRRRHFGEGLTVFRDRVFQVTLGRTGFVYDPRSLRRLRTFTYAGEGWGLAHDGEFVVLSDGTDMLRFVDRGTFSVRRAVVVRDADGRSVSGLNELELVDGAICANVFPTDRVACVDPGSGRVRYWIDLTGLLPAPLRPGDEEAVANGIAYGGHPGRLLVTGKLWPRLFQIQLVRQP